MNFSLFLRNLPPSHLLLQLKHHSETLFGFYHSFSDKTGFSSAVKLLEYDTRFSVYGSDFLLYDYQSPLEIPKEFSSSFDVVVADPPFLSDECLTKTALTMRYLSKGPLILCTGMFILPMFIFIQ